ncbi:MAG TPA: hypothetical protein VJS67_06865 [Pseudonocardiaceae bacterium]|nr:hypothetical protein [Pseudonocardiaceae bacterium]
MSGRTSAARVRRDSFCAVAELPKYSSACGGDRSGYCDPGPPAVLVSSAGSAAVLAGIIQTPGVSHLFGCTPLGPVGWAIAGTATTAATALPPPVLSRVTLPGMASTAVHPASLSLSWAPPPVFSLATVEELLVDVLAASLAYLLELLVVRAAAASAASAVAWPQRRYRPCWLPLRFTLAGPTYTAWT